MKDIFVDREDYKIEHHRDRVVVLLRYGGDSGEERVVANFSSSGSAESFIRRRTTPRDYPSTFFDDICRCGWAKEGWDYVRTGELVYELCNKCNNPLRYNVLKETQKKQLESFDLDEFLNM